MELALCDTVSRWHWSSAASNRHLPLERFFLYTGFLCRGWGWVKAGYETAVSPSASRYVSRCLLLITQHASKDISQFNIRWTSRETGYKMVYINTKPSKIFIWRILFSKEENCREKKPARCHWMVYCTYNMLNIFRALLCPSSGARDYMCVMTAYGVRCLAYWLLGIRCRAAGYAFGMRDVAWATSLITNTQPTALNLTSNNQ